MKKAFAAFLCAGLWIATASVFAQTPSAGKAKAAASRGAVAAPSRGSAAEALYDQMVAAWNKADSIYYESACQARGPRGSVHRSYKVWLKKPNFALLEAYRDGKLTGALVGDGNNFCVYWHGGPPAGYTYENQKSSRDKQAASSAQPAVSYTTYPAPAGRHSIAEGVTVLGLDLVEDPSMFSGAPDPMQPYIDSGRTSGVESVAGEKCDVLVLSCPKAKAEITLWLSQADHLPRKAREVVSGDTPSTFDEEWSAFQLNGEVANNKFAWAPQADWGKIRKATLEDGLLKPKTIAPGFTLEGADGKKISLSDYKGKVVWLHVWRAG